MVAYVCASVIDTNVILESVLGCERVCCVVWALALSLLNIINHNSPAFSIKKLKSLCCTCTRE